MKGCLVNVGRVIVSQKHHQRFGRQHRDSLVLPRAGALPRHERLELRQSMRSWKQ
jgi:hypothetical protein